ncbi:DUF3108 domain-containing protein [Roseisolibacter agri]|uniref:DUF3108 domain-containing protein n=1 Tax=Roseisolibacter agri TaxID=2014610 RepID=A0AA37QAE1_9BACT|nr:DUF3108 domain-containing protein [Roseisolibacter agri]GLC26041.1 hypothetical protein rosag_25540 [Roseisolibacter agri]
MSPRPSRLLSPPLALARGVLVGAALIAVPAAAVQTPAAPVPAVATRAAGGQQPAEAGERAEVPWRVGERSQYEVRFGKLKVGNGSIEVVQLDNVRGREAWHTRFRVTGGTFFYKVNDVLESWFDARTLASLRFVKDQEEGRSDREVRYEIFPERTVYREADGEEQPSVAQPLDDGSFLFFVRTLPLKVGDVYELHRYFKPDRNPVRIRVLRREKVKVPAGTFDAIVVQPSFKTKGIFSENGKAEVWLSDDERRVVLQMKSSLSFGSLNMYLKSHAAGGAEAAGR